MLLSFDVMFHLWAVDRRTSCVLQILVAEISVSGLTFLEVLEVESSDLIIAAADGGVMTIGAVPGGVRNHGRATDEAASIFIIGHVLKVGCPATLLGLPLGHYRC